MKTTCVLVVLAALLALAPGCHRMEARRPLEAGSPGPSYSAPSGVAEGSAPGPGYRPSEGS